MPTSRAPASPVPRASAASSGSTPPCTGRPPGSTSPSTRATRALVVRSQRMVPIRCVNRTTGLLIWWADSPDAWEPSVRIRPLEAAQFRLDLRAPQVFDDGLGPGGVAERAGIFARDLRQAQDGRGLHVLVVGNDRGDHRSEE